MASHSLSEKLLKSHSWLGSQLLLLSTSFIEMQGLLEAVNHHAAVVCIRTNASKTEVISVLILVSGAKLDGEPLEDTDRFKHPGFIFIANGQNTEDIRSKINLARSAFSHLQSSYWSRREVSLRTKGRVYQIVVRLIRPYSRKAWPVRVAHERTLGFLTMTASTSSYM